MGPHRHAFSRFPVLTMLATRSISALNRAASTFTRGFAATNNVIFVLGAPGSGKGKHSDHLVKKFGGDHVSVGEILREARNGCFCSTVDRQDAGQVHRDDQEAHGCRGSCGE